MLVVTALVLLSVSSVFATAAGGSCLGWPLCLRLGLRTGRAVSELIPYVDSIVIERKLYRSEGISSESLGRRGLTSISY